AFVPQGPASGKLVLGDDMIRVSGTGGFFGSEGAAGDLDADGFDDLVVGAPLSEDGEVFGFSGPLHRDRHSDGADAVMSTRAGPGDYAGWELDVSSDLDGDGLPDLLIGAESGPRGSVYVESGTLSGGVKIDLE